MKSINHDIRCHGLYDKMVMERIQKMNKRNKKGDKILIMINNQEYCQSCGMPFHSSKQSEEGFSSNHEKSQYGTNTDGTINYDYCCYCLKDGAFTFEGTMEEMIHLCIPFMIKNHDNLKEEDAKNMMLSWFPNLKRWKSN